MDRDQELQAVYRAGWEQYMDGHPKPSPEEFPCSWCRARAGQTCTVRVKHKSVHRPRTDRWVQALNLRQAAAVQAGDNAVNEWCKERGL